MPSGSHGGGGHCGSSGGGHSSHSSHSGGYSGGGSARSRNEGTYHGRSVRFYYFGGRRYYTPSNVSSVLTAVALLAFIILLAAFICGIDAKTSNDKIKSFERDYDNYQRMIERADGNSKYIIEDAYIKGIYQCEVSADHYYIEYYFHDVFFNRIEGYTYCTYSYDDIVSKGYYSGGYITLAIDSDKNYIEGDVDSINYDYKYTTLEDDADYVYNKMMVGRYSILWKVFLSIGVVIAVGGIALFVLKLKKTNENEKNPDGLEEIKKEVAKKRPELRKCEYCGSVLKDGEIECKNCGGRNDF